MNSKLAEIQEMLSIHNLGELHLLFVIEFAIDPF